MNKLSILPILLILLLTSCKKELYQGSLSEKKRLKIEELDFDYLQAKVRIEYDDGIQNFNASAHIRIRNDSVIWISVSNTGIEMLRAALQKDSVFVIDRMNKEFRTFTYDSLQRTYNLDLNYDMVQSVIVGNLIQPRKNSDRVLDVNGHFILKQHKNNLVIDNFVNSKTMKIERINILDRPSSSKLEIKYEDFQYDGEILFPFKNSVFLTYIKGNSEFSSIVNLDFSRVAIDDKKMKFPFNVPNRYAPDE